MSFLGNLFNRKAVEHDLDDELKSFVELLTAEKVKQGMSPEAARRAALVEAGGVEQIKEEVRDTRRGAWVETTMQDLHYGMRLLRRSPGFAALAVLTIGLGIGANSAIFSVINGVVRKPLAYPDPDRLMFITSQFTGGLNFRKFWMSAPEYFDFKTHTRSFGDVAAYTTGAMNLASGDNPERVNAAFVTANMFRVLRTSPERGRVFTPEEDMPNAEPVAVISHELWHRTFGADPSVVGRTVQIQGRSHLVLGIMPPGFDIHDTKTQLWMPLGIDPADPGNRGAHFLYLVGRLAPGVSLEQAKSELNGMLRQWGDWAAPGPGGFKHVPNDSTHRIQLEPLRDEVIGSVKKALWVLQGAVALVLLIACANVANLLLARAEARHKEFAVRGALGASRSRIMRQFISEGLVLSILGAGLGLALAFWGLRALLAANPDSIPRATEITLDPWVVAFTVVVAVGTGVVFGFAPLLHMGDKAMTLSIKEGGARTTSNAGRNRVRRGLVVAEIALAVMLVIGAGLLLKSFRNLTNVDAGFDPANKVTFGLVLPQAAYPDSQRRVQFFDDLSRQLEQIPGVQRASMVQGLPPFRQVNANDTQFEGYTFRPGTNDPIPSVDYYNTATADYFQTMGVPIVEGRAFAATDAAGAPVVIVNQALVKRFYPGGSALGRRIRPSFRDSTPWFTIVGIAKDVKQGGLEVDVGTELYTDYEQMPRYAGYAPGQMNVVLRTTRSLDAIAPAIRQTVRAVDPALPIVQMRTMEEVIDASVTRQRFLSLLLGIFAAVALTLAAIGTYGILSYMVTEREREIGIRVALGAARAEIMRLVLGQGMTIAAIGIAIGVVGAVVLSRLTTSLLYGVKPSDPATYVAVTFVIAVVASVACVIPMLRATRVDPLEAIRGE
jgi:predicted permease